jgi:hypothetical protein
MPDANEAPIAQSISLQTSADWSLAVFWRLNMGVGDFRRPCREDMASFFASP